MSKKTNKNKNWKDALLRSSLPLEYLISEILHKLDYNILGEYPYIRLNEKGVETEFSVDLHAVKNLKEELKTWGEIHLLIECKYNYQSVNWVFSPQPKDLIFNIKYLKVFDDLCLYRIQSKNYIDEVDKNYNYCMKGIALHENEANSQIITKGLYQLRYALPHLASNILREQIKPSSIIKNGKIKLTYDNKIEYICPILVTTANLFILKKKQNLSNYLKASKINDIANPVNSLIQNQHIGPHLESYADNIFYDNYDEIKKFFGKIEVINKNELLSFLLKPNEIQNLIKTITENILVLNFSEFEHEIENIYNIISRAGKTIVQYAKIND